MVELFFFGGGPSQGVWRGGPMRGLGSGHVTCGPMRGMEINFTGRGHSHGHCDSMTESAQWAVSVKTNKQTQKYTFNL